VPCAAAARRAALTSTNTRHHDTKEIRTKAKQRQTAAEFFDPAKRTPVQQRFYALRESGYTGPIDQNGNENHDSEDVFKSLNEQGRAHGVPGY